MAGDEEYIDGAVTPKKRLNVVGDRAGGAAPQHLPVPRERTQRRGADGCGELAVPLLRVAVQAAGPHFREEEVVELGRRIEDCVPTPGAGVRLVGLALVAPACGGQVQHRAVCGGPSRVADALAGRGAVAEQAAVGASGAGRGRGGPQQHQQRQREHLPAASVA